MAIQWKQVSLNDYRTKISLIYDLTQKKLIRLIVGRPDWELKNLPAIFGNGFSHTRKNATWNC